MNDVRDVFMILLGSALMHGENLTVGQVADLLMKMLENEGYAIVKRP